MRKHTLYGLLEFPEPLSCSADLLGQSTDIVIAGNEGRLTMPSAPEWEAEDDSCVTNPLSKPLLGPCRARTWKHGKELIFWGMPDTYPIRHATVERALFTFNPEVAASDSAAQQIYDGIQEWLDLFMKYVKLLTKQNTACNVFVDCNGNGLHLLIDEHTRLTGVPRPKQPVVRINISRRDETLHLVQFQEAAKLSSKLLAPRFEYILLIEAYNARRSRDYRKAIIEAANALEASLTEKILEEFERQQISFGDKLLQKFRMLGGRFELIKLLGVPLPDKDYETLINRPRNDVVHRGFFPSENLANQVVIAVEELLEILSPQIHQDPNENQLNEKV